MNSFLAILSIIAKHVQKHLGDKPLNELIAQGIAVYLEVVDALPKNRSIRKPTANADIVIAVIEELSELEA
jgi:hypothetical protein